MGTSYPQVRSTSVVIIEYETARKKRLLWDQAADLLENEGSIICEGVFALPFLSSFLLLLIPTYVQTFDA